MNITKYIKLFFISLLSIFITTCGSSGSGVFDDAESATEFTFELSGGNADDFLSDSGDIDQNSQAALNFKASVAAQVGANPDQIEITGIENINSRNELFILSFIFKEDSEGLIAVDTLVEELMDIISTAILDDTSLTIGDYSADIEEIIIDNLDEDISCPFTTDQCGVCNGPGLNQDGCCGEEVLDDCGNCGNTNNTINDANMMLTEMIQRISWCNDNHYDDDYYYYEHTDHYDCSDELSDWDFDVIYDKYQSALGNGTCSNSAAYFGMGITSMFRVTQDQELIDIIDTWDNEDDIIISNDRNSQSKIKSGLPKGTSDFTTLSNINYLNYIPIKHLFNSIINRNSRDNNETIYFSDMQDMIEDVFITKLNDAISHFENVVGNDFMFTITPAMQDDSYADNIEIDDAEIYVMKAYMHSLRALLYAISTYNLDFINSDNFDDGPADGFDFTQLQQNGDYLSIRNGSQNNLPNAFDDLNDIFTSLQSAYTFLGNHVHPNGVLSWDDVSGQDVYDALFIDGPNILNNTHTVEDVCIGGESHSYWGWYDGEYYQNDYNDEICYDINVNLKNVMETPINDFKDLLPSYTISDLDNQKMELEWDGNCEHFESNETCLENGDGYLSMYYEWKSDECWAGIESEWHWYGWYYECQPQSDSYPNEYSNMIPMCGSTDNCDCSYANTYAEQMLTNIIDDIGISDLLHASIQYSESDDHEWCYDILYKDYYTDPCLTWNQNSYSQWQSAWPDVTMSGLFPNMTLNKFLDLTGISQEDDDWWEQSSCSEDDD